MSYCRWSTDNFTCDVYVYESIYDQWEIHVAGNKRINHKLPAPEDIDFRTATIEQIMEHHSRGDTYNKSAEVVPIGLPEDGKSFYLDSPGECAEKLEYLLGLGYNVPQDVIDTLKQEQQDLDANQ